MLNLLFKVGGAFLFCAALIYPLINRPVNTVSTNKPLIDDATLGQDKVKATQAVLNLVIPARVSSKDDQPIPDFSAIVSVKERKSVFFSYFLRLAVKHNQWIAQNRQFVKSVREAFKNKQRLTPDVFEHLNYLYKRYRMTQPNQLSPAKRFRRLLKRMDEVPVELVLAQAANESGWGRSRFAKQGHNYFGKWCFRQGCGLVPQSREDHLDHEVKKYSSPFASVQDYFLNVNRNQNYKTLRDLRAQFRRLATPPRAEVLAGGLLNYSERGVAYVEEIIGMIRSNQELIDDLKLTLTSQLHAQQTLKLFEQPALLNKTPQGN